MPTRVWVTLRRVRRALPQFAHRFVGLHFTLCCVATTFPICNISSKRFSFVFKMLHCIISGKQWLDSGCNSPVWLEQIGI